MPRIFPNHIIDLLRKTVYYSLNQIKKPMDTTNIEQIIQAKVTKLLPDINRLTTKEVKHYIFANRKHEAQRQNLRSAWRCGQSPDSLLTIEQEFSLHKGLAIEADSTIEELRSILVTEIEASLRKQLEVQSWMVIGGQVP